MRHYYNGYNPTQQQLQTTQRGLGLIFKWACKGLLYCPLLLTGYLICTLFLDKKAHGLLWFGLPVLLAYLLYIVMMFAKSTLNKWKANGTWLWVPLFIICVSFTCILPAYVAYQPINYIVKECNGNQTVTILLTACLTAYVYFRYDFLNHRMKKEPK